MIYVQEPLITPVSNWCPPAYFPKIGDVFGFDCETKDPGVNEIGPGSLRKTGYPVGVSLAQEIDGKMEAYYFPWRHEGGGNMDKGVVLRYLKPILEDPIKLLIGANILYELEWMAFEGIDIKCQLWDVQVAEALLDEEAMKFSLDVLCQKYLGAHKNETLLIEACQAWGYVGRAKGRTVNMREVKANLWRLPSKYVGPYAESDAGDPIRIYHKQKPLLEKESLLKVMKMEMDLLPVIWKMRKQGVRVNLDWAEQVHKEWKLKEQSLYVDLRKMVNGVSMDSVWSNEQIEAGAIKLDLAYPRTKTGQASFTAPWFEGRTEPYWKAILEIREVNKLNDTFIRQSILENAIGDRVHCQFHPTRRDEGGARTGRLSCSNPNLQQSPNPEHSEDAWKVRAIFVPERGEKWGKLDYSQQEPRLVVHYGCLQNYRGADSAAREYINNPKADFYQILVKLAGVTRSEAKKLYLGRSYGMGKDKLARSLGITVKEAMEIADAMDAAVPFIKELSNDLSRVAGNRGFIQTIGGRRAHFNSYEPARYKEGAFYIPKSLEEAKKEWPNENLKRAGTHKAMNKLIQGGAADMTKIALLHLYAEGILPMLQLHDELDISFADPKVADRAKEIMEHAVKLKIPVYADLKVGNNWGEAA